MGKQLIAVTLKIEGKTDVVTCHRTDDYETAVQRAIRRAFGRSAELKPAPVTRGYSGVRDMYGLVHCAGVSTGVVVHAVTDSPWAAVI